MLTLKIQEYQRTIKKKLKKSLKRKLKKNVGPYNNRK